MKLKHDGNSWSASLTVQAVNSNGVLSITAKNTAGVSITIKEGEFSASLSK